MAEMGSQRSSSSFFAATGIGKEKEKETAAAAAAAVLIDRCCCCCRRLWLVFLFLLRGLRNFVCVVPFKLEEERKVFLCESSCGF